MLGNYDKFPTIVVFILGDNETSGDAFQRRDSEQSGKKTGPSVGDSAEQRARDPVRRPQKHQPHCAEETGRPQK